MHDDVGTVLDGPAQVRAGERVVDHERDVVLMGDASHLLEVEDVALRVADRLAMESARIGTYLRSPLVKVVAVVHERHLDAQLRQRVVKQVVGAAIQRRRAHDVVAHLGQVQDGEGLSRLTTSERQRACTAFEAGDALLEHLLCRVHDACVDVAGLTQREQSGGVGRVAEGVAGGLIDRRGPGSGGRIGLGPGVDLTRFETSGVALAHVVSSSPRRRSRHPVPATLIPTQKVGNGITYGERVGAPAAEQADLARFVSFTRDEWRPLRAATPLSLGEADLSDLRGINDRLSLDEVADVYLPLSRLLNLYVAAAQSLHKATDTFLGTLAAKVPYVIGIAGSVAVGKSTTARVMQALLRRWPDHPAVDLVTTDGFLHPNEILEARGIVNRKGFPESYDVRRLNSSHANISYAVFC